MTENREDSRPHNRAMTMLKRKGLAFAAALGVEVERAERYGRPLTLLVFHISRDTRAHKSVWDDQRRHLLAEMTDAAVATFRAPDFCAPLPGGHFGVCLPETDRAGATHAASKLRLAIAKRDGGGRIVGSAIGRIAWSATERDRGEADPAAYLARAVEAARAAAAVAELDASSEPAERGRNRF